MDIRMRLLVRMLRQQGIADEHLLGDLLRISPDVESLLRHLVAHGTISKDWAVRAGDSVRRKARGVPPDAKTLVAQERSFGQLALRKGLVAVSELEAGILEQQRLFRMNLRFRIGEILVRQGVLTVEQVREILTQQGKSTLRCGSCGAVVVAQEGNQECSSCHGELREPGYLSVVRADQ
ncbi:MAG: hypothetical protein AAF581_13365 [Planctomycetota bacterium]